MAQRPLTPAQAERQFSQGFHCSQVVLAHAADEVGLDEEMARRIAGGLGGGAFHGELCGCVSGAILALSLQYGFDQPFATEDSARLTAQISEFTRRFQEAHGSIVCRELLKYDFADPEQARRIMAEKLFLPLCPQLAASACAMLDEML